MEDYARHDATGLAGLVDAGQTTPLALLEEATRRAEAAQSLGAVVRRFDDHARAKIADGLPTGPLTGVPFLLKDLGAEAVDYPADSGSAVFAGATYPENATLLDRLLAAGLVIFGRTATPEGAVGVATEARHYGQPTRNPWNPEHTPGGSSGGAAAAVAAGIIPAAHASDGGGSIRVPASCCGLVGFKPSRARLPDGPFAGESWAGLATDGFLSRSLRDTALLLDIVAGPDTGQPYFPPPMDGTFVSAMERPPRPLRIAICDTTLSGAEIQAPCAEAARKAGDLLTSLGHRVDAARPEGLDTDAMFSAWTDIVATGLALSAQQHSVATGTPVGELPFEPVAQGALAHAETISGARYLECVEIIHAYGRRMAGFFRDWDVLVTPTLAEAPARIGRFNHDTPDYLDYRRRTFEYSPFTAPFNASGQPAVSLPLAMSEDGLPIGVHFAASPGEDGPLMALAAQIERAAPWAHRRPAQTRMTEPFGS